MNGTNKKCSSCCPPGTTKYFCLLRLNIVIGVVCVLSNTCIAEKSNKWLPMNEVDNLYKVAKEAKKEFNIRLDTKTWVEWKADISDPCSTWEKTPVCTETTAWFENGFNGRVRIDVHKQVLPWVDGPTPYGDTSYSRVFNGKNNIKVVYSTTGEAGKRFPGNNAEIGEYSLKTIKEDPFLWWNSGVGFYSYFCLPCSYLAYCPISPDGKQPYFDGGVDSVLGQISEKTDPNDVTKMPFGVQFESLKGTDLLVIGDKYGITRCWLDPKKNFSLVKYLNATVRKNGERIVRLDIEVSSIEEVSPGIWWPMEVFWIAPEFEPKGGWNRIVYRASNVKISAEPFPDKLFELEIPDGYLVRDNIAKKTYKKEKTPKK